MLKRFMKFETKFYLQGGTKTAAVEDKEVQLPLNDEKLWSMLEDLMLK